MLAIVSHDLRNPLSVVMMAAKLIERGASPDPSGDRLRKQAKAIINEIERMNRLVIDLLDLSKIEAGRSLHVELARRDGAEVVEAIGGAARTPDPSQSADARSGRLPGDVPPRLRRRAYASSVLESDRQRHQVHTRRGLDHRQGCSFKGRHRLLDQQHGDWNPPSSSPPSLRPLLASQLEPKRCRSGALDRQGDRSSASRPRLGRDRGGSREYLLLRATGRSAQRGAASRLLGAARDEAYGIEQASCTRGTE